MWTPDLWYREARLTAEKNAEFIRGMADLWLNTLSDNLPEWTQREIVERLQKENKKRLDAVPDLTKYPELRGMRDLLEAGWRGERDGAGMNEAQFAAHCGANYFYHRYVSRGRAATGCTAVYFPRSDYGPLIANNLDSTPDEPFGDPGWPALSEHLIISTVSSGVFLDEEPPEIFPAPVMKLVARYCRNAREAVEMLERYNYFWGPCNALVVDREQNVAMIEKTACRMAVRWSEDGFGFVTAMAQEDPGIREYVNERREASLQDRGLSAPCVDTVYWAAQEKRRVLLSELLDEARKNPTLEMMQRMMHFRCETRGCAAVCGEPIQPELPDSLPFEHTLKTQIVMLREGQARWWTYDIEKNIPVWENPRPDFEFPETLAWR